MMPGMIQGPIKFSALMQILTSLLLDVITGTTSVDPLACLNKPKQPNEGREGKEKIINNYSTSAHWM